MSQDTQKGLAVIQHQLKELDKIYQDAMETLNMASGTERVAKWRVKTVAALTEAVDQKAGQEFARIQPGPSFTNDMVEEFTDLVDCFKIPLTALSKKLSDAVPGPSSGG